MIRTECTDRQRISRSVYGPLIVCTKSPVVGNAAGVKLTHACLVLKASLQVPRCSREMQGKTNRLNTTDECLVPQVKLADNSLP